MGLCNTIVTRYRPRSGQQWFYVLPLLPAARSAAGNNGFMDRKSVLRANHLIYTPAAYVITFSRLYSYGNDLNSYPAIGWYCRPLEKILDMDMVLSSCANDGPGDIIDETC
jgi:hypothetical protein